MSWAIYGKGNPLSGWVGLLVIVVIIVEILRGFGLIK
jgi:hypothetical protein